MSIYTTPREFQRIKRIVDYSYADELKHYCEWVASEYGDTAEAERVDSGEPPARKYKGHIFYDLFYMNRSVERVLKSKTNA
jgi:hypothetical protein